ncbi:MAG: phospholipid/cholesterol/gamma-HCH transport system substrate-binding protein [Solirubrobacteraceae bacterium]|jgi:virulence factor Mce-like protein|nr:phospholipid/cholesterol/gamma-HCH transport system substrate-binding protein [Solirubrobacteraceae bacterium]MEA2353977.1 phospholipid/cholesterol/gamma-HCH transport system substrate-binding protein [Solirubrobacteraceae bacterium]
MARTRPTLGRLLVIAGFALSCFGLLLYLWVSFGGPIPLKPKGYRFRAAFPRAVQLSDQADVRVAGISVGKVVSEGLDRRGNRTVATIEVDSRFAPVRVDARAILRQKTLLGETYIELTPGAPGSPSIPEGGMLADARIGRAVTLDQVVQAFDPITRQAFRNWQQDLARGTAGRGQSLNDALGNLPRFVAGAGDVLDVLNAQSGAVRRLVRNTGVVFGAVSQDRQALHDLIVGADETFGATASEQRALAETVSILPTFLDETRATLARLETFAVETRPLIRDLGPAARDLAPTLHDVRVLAPDLRRTFQKLDPLITSAKTGLPALRDIVRAVTPLLGSLDPFLEQLNPILQWLEYNQYAVGDFISTDAGTLAATTTPSTSQEVGHYLRQYSPLGPETLAIYPTRYPNNRGNAYQAGTGLADSPEAAKHLIFPNFDCKPSGGDVLPNESVNPLLGSPGCFTATPPAFDGSTGAFPHVDPASYNP